MKTYAIYIAGTAQIEAENEKEAQRISHEQFKYLVGVCKIMSIEKVADDEVLLN
jgi:hypothetical protein